MTEDEWTLNDHLRRGAVAVLTIAADASRPDPQPICHHFLDLVDPLSVNHTATHSHLIPLFKDLGVDFLADRLEAWEVTSPSLEWLEERIPSILQAATEAGMDYQGWTWEPNGRQPVGSCKFTVVNNKASAQ